MPLVDAATRSQRLVDTNRSAPVRRPVKHWLKGAVVLLICFLIANLALYASAPVSSGHHLTSSAQTNSRQTFRSQNSVELRQNHKHKNPTKYITFLACQGYAEQIAALYDGIAVCYLLNSTCVLPDFYREYNQSDPRNQIPNEHIEFDPQLAYATKIHDFIDVGHFIHKISEFVNVVPELPYWLQGETSGAFDDVQPLDPSHPSTVNRVKWLLEEKNVLRLRCALDLIIWSTKRMGVLRKSLSAAIKSSIKIISAQEVFAEAIATAVGDEVPWQFMLNKNKSAINPYIAVHIPDGPLWQKYCREGSLDSSRTQVQSFEKCAMGVHKVAKKLVQLGLHRRYKTLYVSHSNLSHHDARYLLKTGNFNLVVAAAVACYRTAQNADVACRKVEVLWEGSIYRDAVEMLLLEGSSFFVGNMYSRQSWMTRIKRTMLRNYLLEPPSSIYFNMNGAYSAGDVQLEEYARYSLAAGTIHPEWHSKELHVYMGLIAMQVQERCLHLHNWGQQCSEIRSDYSLLQSSSITITHLQDGGQWLLQIKGYIAVGIPALNWHPELSVFINGALRGSINSVVQKYDVIQAKLDALDGSIDFAAEIPFLPEDLQSVSSSNIFHVAVCLDPVPSVCSKAASVRLKPALQMNIKQAQDSVVWIWFQGGVRSGGPEALHQLHQEINRWHAAGQIFVRSVFPEGDNYYLGPHSNFSRQLQPHQIGPQDYIVVPEHQEFKLPKEIHVAMTKVGAQGIVWHLGQHATRLAGTLRGKEDFKPVCLSPYFARLLDCPPKAIINVPMADMFLDMGTQVDEHSLTKEDLVLYDWDETYMFDPSKLELPAGAQLVLLKGFNREQVVSLLSRAKVYIDSFLTGSERGVYESALLNVVPIIAEHGPGTSFFDFPLPKRYKWSFHDYNQLSDTVQFAIHHHDEALREVRPFKEHVLSMRSMMSQSVCSYFQDDVHIMIPLVGPQKQALSNAERTTAFAALVFTMIQYPFATQEIVVDNPYYAEFDAAGILYQLFNAGQLSSYSSSQVQPEYRRFGSRAIYLQRPLHRHVRRYTLIISPHSIPLHPNLVAGLLKAASDQVDNTAVFGPDGVLLAHWPNYYDIVNDNLQYFKDDFSTAELQRYLKQMNRPFLVIDGMNELPQSKVDKIPWLQSVRCNAAMLQPLQNTPISKYCCREFMSVVSQGLWVSTFSKYPVDKVFASWIEQLESHCRSL